MNGGKGAVRLPTILELIIGPCNLSLRPTPRPRAQPFAPTHPHAASRPCAGGSTSDIYLIMCRTGDETARGISCIAVEARPSLCRDFLKVSSTSLESAGTSCSAHSYGQRTLMGHSIAAVRDLRAAC